MSVVIPRLNTYGTDYVELIEQRKDVLRMFFNLEQAMNRAAPHRRDYHPDDELYDQAIEQHRKRVEVLYEVRKSFEEETSAMMDVVSK